MKKYAVNQDDATRLGVEWGKNNQGSKFSPEKGILVSFDGSERQAYFFGNGTYGAIVKFDVQVGNITCTPAEVNNLHEVTAWRFSPELPPEPGGVAKVKGGVIYSVLMHGQTLGMKRARRTQWNLDPQAMQWVKVLDREEW